MSDDLLLSLLSEDVEADLPCFAPTPQADPESFEKDFEELDLDNFDGNVQFLTPLDDPLHMFRGFIPSPGLASPSESTCTTESSEDPASSEYSFMTNSTSNYSAPFDFVLRDVDFGSEYNGVGPKHNIFPDSSAFLDSLDPQLSLAFFHHVQVVEAQSDDGPYRPSVGISPHSLSTAFQSPPPAVPTDPPICDTSTTQTRTGPIRTKKYICPDCGHRKWNFLSFFF